MRDKVDILAGFVLTPNALAVGDVSAEAKKFMVVMNAATSIITTKSPYMVRTSVTMPQVNETFGTWAAEGRHARRSYTMVTDYGPGHDFEGGVPARLQGGRRRDRRLGALPGGEPGLLRLRAARQGHQSGSDHASSSPAARSRRRSARRSPSAASIRSKTKVLGSGETTAEQALKSMGDARSASSPPGTTTTPTRRRRTSPS